MIGTMHDEDPVTIECPTCPATGTTACNDCIVAHVLANDDGPIAYAPASLLPAESATDLAIELFVAAGLLDDPPCFVEPGVFEGATAATGRPTSSGAR